jgi:DnaJ-domain-containing protein 1
MTRRVRLPPVPQLRIESLSTGKVVREQEYDELDGGKPLPMPMDTSPDRPLAGAEDVRAQRQAAAQAAKRKLWTMLKPDKVPQLGRKVELIPKGKRKIAEWDGKAVLIDMPKWRRF